VESQYHQWRGGEWFGAPRGSQGSMWDHRGRVTELTSCSEPPHCKGGRAPLLLHGAATLLSSVPSALPEPRPDLPQQPPLAWIHTADADQTPLPVSNRQHLHFGARSFISHCSQHPESRCAAVKTGRSHQSYPSDLVTTKQPCCRL